MSLYRQFPLIAVAAIMLAGLAVHSHAAPLLDAALSCGGSDLDFSQPCPAQTEQHQTANTARPN